MLITLCFVFVCTSGHSFADDVDQFLESEMQKQKIPGVALAVVRDGELVRSRGYGSANLEHQVAVRPETIFQSGSVGKQFTAAGIMLLVEEGKLNLDDAITKYFPDSPDFWSKITVRHLLAHTSGIPDYTEEAIDYRKDYSEEDLLKILKTLKPEFSAGEEWSYSNSGYMLLGFLIHRVSGKFYGDFLRERIFTPLGMSTTRVISESDLVPNRASGYELQDGTLRNHEWVSPSLNTTADGALYLTILDLAKWESALHEGSVLRKTSWQHSWSPVKLADGTTYPYGFGWGLNFHRGHAVIEHSGHWQGFSTAISRFVEYGLTVIVLANLSGVDTLRLAHSIGGLLHPDLLHPGMLKPQSGDEAALRLKEFGKALASFGSEDEDLKAIREKRIATAFHGCDNVAGKQIELRGAGIDRFCYYSVTLPEKNQIVTVAFTTNGKAADISVE